MDGEIKDWSKDWPVFKGHVILDIAWKQEWTAHYMENFTQGFRVMPEESAAGAVPQASRKRGYSTSPPWPRSGRTWTRPTLARTPSCMT
jgi:hypothetical protein